MQEYLLQNSEESLSIIVDEKPDIVGQIKEQLIQRSQLKEDFEDLAIANKIHKIRFQRNCPGHVYAPCCSNDPAERAEGYFFYFCFLVGGIVGTVYVPKWLHSFTFLSYFGGYYLGALSGEIAGLGLAGTSYNIRRKLSIWHLEDEEKDLNQQSNALNQGENLPKIIADEISDFADGNRP